MFRDFIAHLRIYLIGRVHPTAFSLGKAYLIYPKYSDRPAYASSINPDQTAPEGKVRSRFTQLKFHHYLRKSHQGLV